MTNHQLYTGAGLFLLLLTGLSGCAGPASPNDVLADAVRKIRDSPSVRYESVSFWDNRMNASTYADSARIIFSKTAGSARGLGFYADYGKYALLFDGGQYVEIRHSDKTLVRHDPTEIKADSNYFSDMMLFEYGPLELLKPNNYDRIFDTLLDNRAQLAYRETERRPSAGDSSRTIRHERFYYIDRDTRTLRRMLNVILLDADTLQVIRHDFSAMTFGEEQFNFNAIDRSAFAGYREIGLHELEDEQYLKQPKAGDRLKRRSYRDLDGREVALFRAVEKTSLVMFSFIGCGACERALQDMRNQGFRLKPGLNFYYCSPVDSPQALRSYLSGKGFPFSAFSRDSGMQDEFPISYFPSFVWIDATGKVTRLMSGYDDEVKALLFE